ncbi:MAG: hypothetical protein ACYDH8_12545 [Syntrophales bacterium]
MRRLIFLYTGMILVISFLSADCFAAGFTREAIEFEARLLMNRMEITRDVSYELKKRLKTELEDTALSNVIDSMGVGAVFAYSSGEGGIFVKYMAGDGLISFVGGRQAAPVLLNSLGVGAMIGGSAQWGIGLVIGRVDEENFGGRYKGGVRTATAWEVATGAISYFSRTNGEETKEIYVISTGRGFSAGVGGVIMSITPAW